jgi:hypothetical protein
MTESAPSGYLGHLSSAGTCGLATTSKCLFLHGGFVLPQRGKYSNFTIALEPLISHNQLAIIMTDALGAFQFPRGLLG